MRTSRIEKNAKSLALSQLKKKNSLKKILRGLKKRKERELMNIPNSYVCKEQFNGKWSNSYFDNEPDAKKLCMKIIAKGGCAVWMKNGN